MRARPGRLRFAPFFQIVLAGQPEHAGPLRISRDPSLPALFFENPRNTFRTGPAFVAHVRAARLVMETRRGRFFGPGRSVAHPLMVESGEPDAGRTVDDRPVAALLTTLEIPARGEHTVVVILGQAEDRNGRRRRSSPSTRMSPPPAPPWKRPGDGGSASWTRSRFRPISRSSIATWTG